MTEIYPNLFIGSLADYQSGPFLPFCDWFILHAAKEPYHREFVGYEGRGAPKDDPEYLVALRGHRMALNLVDAEDPAYIPKACVDAGVEFVLDKLNGGKKVLIHCNMGISRAPTIGLLVLLEMALIPRHQLECAVKELKREEICAKKVAETCNCGGVSFDQAERIFKKRYPNYAPGKGMRGFLEKHLKEVCKIP